VLLISLFKTLKIGAMTSEIKAKRDELKAMSAAAKMLVKEGAADSVNDGLAIIYKDQGHEVLKSYRQWQQDGYQVKKGSKALLMWAQPKKLGKVEDAAAEEKKDEFFPIAYVFSNLQVEPK
jgi:hypothetical protein